ncbi:MAG: PIG-L family deacetylase [Bryobacteraceae bacterium]|nr:PIG-L family deacetylase [Bryobacteraceae bacterium]
MTLSANRKTSCRRAAHRLVLVAPHGGLAAPATEQSGFPRLSAPPASAPKVLLIVAHPDDEYYVAATIYRIASELGGTVDQVVITNGEAGFHYAQLAERFYGVALTGERDGRAHLPAIRKEETRRAGRILGIRNQYFLDEQDNRFALDAEEALTQAWDRGRVVDSLVARLEAESYDFVFVILPRDDTHGHHKAAAVLALDAVSRVSSERRPIVLGAEPAHSADAAPEFRGLRSFPATATVSGAPAFSFDRTKSFGHDGALRYEIVVNWVIAEHKSQGLFQGDCGRHDVERFWLFDQPVKDAQARVRALSNALHGTKRGVEASRGLRQAARG